MRRLTDPFAVFTLAAVASVAPAQAPLPSDITDAWRNYRDRFTHATGTGKYEETVRSKSETTVMAADFAFAFAPEGRRGEFTLIRNGKPDPRLAIGQNSKYVFRLEHRDAGWILVAVYMAGDDKERSIRRMLDGILANTRALTAVEYTPLLDLADDLTASTADGRSEVALVRPREVMERGWKKHYKTVAARLNDDEFRTVASLQTEYKHDPGAYRLERVVTPVTRGGLPVPSVVKKVYRNAEHGTETTRIDSYDIDPTVRLPEREFTLSAYGLPEPFGVEWPKPTPTYVWLLAGAGGFAVLAVLFRSLARRGHRPNPNPAPA